MVKKDVLHVSYVKLYVLRKPLKLKLSLEKMVAEEQLGMILI